MKISEKFNEIADGFAKSRSFKWILLIVMVVIYTFVLYPQLSTPGFSYRLGDVVERDVKAPVDFLVEDKEATAERIKKAESEVLTLYDYDDTLLNVIVGRITDAFKEMEALIKQEKRDEDHASGLAGDSRKEPGLSDLRDLIWQKKELFEKKLGCKISDNSYKMLEHTAFSRDLYTLIIKIITPILENGVVANKELLLKESERGVIFRALSSKEEKVVDQLRRFYGLEQAKKMVRIIGQPLMKNMNPNLREAVVEICQSLIHPNITLNSKETIERKRGAASRVKPVLYQIKAGEMLLREGERVTSLQLKKLEALKGRVKKGRLEMNAFGVAGLSFLLFLIAFAVRSGTGLKSDSLQNKDLLFLGTVFFMTLFVAKIAASIHVETVNAGPFAIPVQAVIYGLPLGAASMILSIFLGREIAVMAALVMAVLVALLFHNRLEIFIYFFLSGALAAYWTQCCRERKVFIKSGVKLGLANMVLAAVIEGYLGTITIRDLLWHWLFAFSGGVVTGVIASGFLPLIELIFSYTTDIKLLELANLDQPILRRLMIEAPGTYHHSVVVGSMVEAAAREIDANPLLAKVCGYYHDIGKINKPLYFIENQTDGDNRHDRLAPSMSKRILVAHVKDGVNMAREHRLGKPIIDTIKQSHGTSVITYFYEKARKLKGDSSVKIDDFRYPGPKPQTREAGLVMLADVVEAASRTLENPTPARIQGLVQRLINSIFSDGQLDECELTLKDLHEIAKSFNKILNGIYHHRVEYSTETPYLVNGKDKNGGIDRQQAGSDTDRSGKDEKKSHGHLKRLGI